jgi:hypothetical protein
MGMPTVQFFSLFQESRYHVLEKYLQGVLRGRSKIAKCFVPQQRDWCIELCCGVATILVLLLLFITVIYYNDQLYMESI